jgi:C4-dicarboxylate-specific signal transduction histidine kinase
MKVLIVDDDPQIRKMLGSFLARTGWTIESAGECDEAMKILDDSCDVVLSDVKMQESSGIDLLRRVRESFPFIEVIMMTGYEDLQDSIEALNLRAFGYLKKPFDMSALNEILIRAARSKDARLSEAHYKKALEEQVALKTRQLTVEKERFETIFSVVPSLLLILDHEFKLVDCNRLVEQFTGATSEELAGSLLCQVLYCECDCKEKTPGELPENCYLMSLMTPVLKGETDISRDQIMLSLRKSPESQRMIFRTSCCQLPGQAENARLLLLMLDDITHEKEMEFQLSHTSKIMALGEMATGVAHELNQPLNGMAAYIQLLEFRLASGKETPTEEQSRMFSDMMQEVKRMSQIVEHLRVFSRTGKLSAKKQLLDIRAVYYNASKLLRAQIMNSGIQLEEHFQENLPPVSGNGTRLEQVFLNLLLNARDAVEALSATGSQGGASHPGAIRVSVTREVREERSGILLQVADNGVGVQPQHLERIFDPFFTTKEPGKGTGLGLAIIQGIIKDMEGTIGVQSEPGCGAEFRVWLPSS